MAEKMTVRPDFISWGGHEMEAVRDDRHIVGYYGNVLMEGLVGLGPVRWPFVQELLLSRGIPLSLSYLESVLGKSGRAIRTLASRLRDDLDEALGSEAKFFLGSKNRPGYKFEKLTDDPLKVINGGVELSPEEVDKLVPSELVKPSILRGPYIFDPNNRLFSKVGEPNIPLTREESDVMGCLIQREGYLSPEELIRLSGLPSVGAVRQRLSSLRRKIEPGKRRPSLIGSSHRSGYFLRT